MKKRSQTLKKNILCKKIINKLTKNVTVESFSDTHIMEHTKKEELLKKRNDFHWNP